MVSTLQGYNFEICYRKSETNKNADAHSRREYPGELDEGKEPKNDIPSVDVNEVSLPETTKPLEVTFIYNNTPSSQKCSINELSTLNPGDDLISDNIGKLQSECPDLKHIYQYLSNGTLPDDKK